MNFCVTLILNVLVSMVCVVFSVFGSVLNPVTNYSEKIPGSNFSSDAFSPEISTKLSPIDKKNVVVTIKAVLDSCGRLFNPHEINRLHETSGELSVSVIIGTYNRHLSLDAIIKVLKRQRLVDNLEIIVSDGGSWPPVFLLVPDRNVDVVIYRRFDGKYHRVRSFNEGVRASKYDVLIFLDDDVIPASDFWAFAALSALQKSNASIVRMPMYLSPDLQMKHDLSDALVAQAHLAQPRSFQISDWTTVNMAIRKSVWESVGGLNWSYDGKYGYEDFEFHSRVKQLNICYARAEIFGCAVHIGTFYKKRFPTFNNTQYNAAVPFFN